MERIIVQGKILEYWAEKLEVAYIEVNNILTSDQINNTGRTASDLTEIDKDDLCFKVDTLAGVIKLPNIQNPFKSFKFL